MAVGGLALDDITKIIAVALLDPQRPVALLDGLLTLRLIRNSGAAFSLGEQFTYAFALLALAVVAVVIVKFVPRIGHPAWAVALGLLVAGVSGNLVDRIFRAPGPLRGHVVDFLQLPHWPIFNVADMCITSAAVLIMFLAIIKGIGLDGRRYTRPAAEAPPQPAAKPAPAKSAEDE